MTQWLGLHAVTAKGSGSIFGPGTNIPQASWHGQKINKALLPYQFASALSLWWVLYRYLWQNLILVGVVLVQIQNKHYGKCQRSRTVWKGESWRRSLRENNFFFFLVAQTVKNLPIMQDTGVQSLGRELLIHLFGCTGSLVVALVIFAVSGGISPCGTRSL